jgi:SulP family sulfate permease
MSDRLRAFFPTPVPGDLIAGVSVAVILIPQALAYAALAGLPPVVGLFAAALPPIAAAIFASSPYLQTGPVAMTALLTFGALSPIATPASDEYVKLAALLALIVGAVRVIVGTLRAGAVAYLMSQPVVQGFTAGAAVLIVASQLSTVVGAAPPDGGVLWRAWWTLTHGGQWEAAAVVVGMLTVVIVTFGRRIHPLFPSVLVAVVGALLWSVAVDYSGPVVGEVPAGFPPFSLALPWSRVTDIAVAGAVIALVGFAEPASIARAYAARERRAWSPDREFVSQGVANLASGISGGLPVGGSFARTSINHLAGARTRWSGAFAGLVVFAFLPFAGVIERLPLAVLGAIIVAAVVKLIRVPALLSLWRYSKPQALVAYVTFIATLVLAPRIDQAVLVGIVTAIAIHLWRERVVSVDLEVRRGGVARIRPQGVFWFGSAPDLAEAMNELMASYPEANNIEIDLSGLGRIDYSSAVMLRDLVNDARKAGYEVDVIAVPDHARRILRAVWAEEIR